MATKKEPVTQETKPKTTKTVTKTVDKDKEEIEQLKKQNAEMQAKMEELMQTQMNLLAQLAVKPKDEGKNRNITFISLVDGMLLLKGSKMWEFNGRYAKHIIREHEAKNILANMPQTIRDGYVYIADAEFVKDNDLEEVYENLLSDKDLKHLLNQSADYVVSVYKNASEAQKQIIIDMVSEQKISGKKIDNNILVELGELSGKDLLHLEE